MIAGAVDNFSSTHGSNYVMSRRFSAQQDRRRQPRVNCDLSAAVRSLSSRRYNSLQIKDLSLSGFKIMASVSLEPLQKIFIVLSVPKFQKKNPLLCSVIWSYRDSAGQTIAGIAFMGLNNEQESLLRYLFLMQSEIDQTKHLSFHAYALIGSSQSHRDIYDRLNALKLHKTVYKYAKISSQISKRKILLWQWCRYLNERLTLSCVAPKYVRSLNDAKTIDLIFMTLLDDIVDERKNGMMFKEARKIIAVRAHACFENVSEEERYFLEMCREMWCYVYETMRSFPRYQEFADFFFYDYNQLINSFEYSILVNIKSHAINDYEYSSYLSHSMHVLLNAMVDIMCSPTFDASELGLLRRVVMDVQIMCRICNWITTWERELAGQDLTSGIVALALKTNVISLADLKNPSKLPLLIEQIKSSDIVERLFLEWEKKRYAVEVEKDKIKSVDVRDYLNAADEFLTYSFAFKGIY